MLLSSKQKDILRENPDWAPHGVARQLERKDLVHVHSTSQSQDGRTAEISLTPKGRVAHRHLNDPTTQS